MSMQSRFGLLIARLLKLLNRQAKSIRFLAQLGDVDILDVFAEPTEHRNDVVVDLAGTLIEDELLFLVATSISRPGRTPSEPSKPGTLA